MTPTRLLQKRKLFLAATLALALAAGGGLPAHLAGGSTVTSAQASPLGVLQAIVSAEDARDWPALLALTASADRADLAAFLANDQNRLGDLGVFNIEQASLAEVKELPDRIAAGVVDLDRYRSLYGEARVFYAGIQYRVRREGRFYYNGVNYRLAVLVPEDGAWRLAELSAAPMQRLATGEAAFNSETERVALEIDRARDHGLVINAAGQVLERLDSPAPVPSPETPGQSGPPPDSTQAPASPTSSLPPPRAESPTRPWATAIACVVGGGAALAGVLIGLRRARRGRRGTGAPPAPSPRSHGDRTDRGR